MPARSSASRFWAVPTRSVPRPRWLCVARGTSSRILSTSSPKPAAASRSAASPRTRSWAHGHALIPVASTPTTRRAPAPFDTAIPISETISCVCRPVTGVRRRCGQPATIRTSARSAFWRSTICVAIRSASASTWSPSPRTTSSIAWSKSSGKRDMWTPFWSRARSTVQSISAAIRISWSPRRMRIAFWTPVTPARESARPTGGAEACMSRTSGRSLTPVTLHPVSGRGQELEQRPCEGLGMLERWEMRDGWKLDQLRARDLLGEQPRDLAEAALVERTDEDERRPCDFSETLAAARRQPAALGGRVLVLERGMLHLEHAPPQGLRHHVLAAGRPVQPGPDIDPRDLVEIAALERRRLLVPGGDQGRIVLPSVDPGSDEHEAVDQVGVREREVESDMASERDADDVGLLDPEALEERGRVGRVDERAVGNRRLAEPAEVGRDDPEALRQHRRHVVPHSPVGDPGMEKQERRAPTGLVVRDVDAVHADRCHPPSVPRAELSEESERACGPSGSVRRSGRTGST